MSNFTQKISVIVEMKTGQVKSGLAGIRSAIAGAEGGMAKFKAGAAAMGNSLGNVLGSAAGIPIVGGYIAAVGKMSMKAADEFTALAKSALDTAAATGLGVEEASRWIAVADDAGITADQFAAGVGKIDKALATNKTSFADVGIATKDAAGEQRSANDILLDTLAYLSSIQNPTQRAIEGNKLLGKSWASLAPIVGHTRAEYENMLGSVSDGQTITKAEAAKAEKWRKAMDDLQDSLHDVTLAMGEMVVQLAPMIEGFAHMTEGVLSKYNSAMQRAEDNINRVKIAIGDYTTALPDLTAAVLDAADSQDRNTRSVSNMRDGIENARNAADGLAAKERDAAYQAAQMRDRVSEATAKVKDFHDELSDHKSLIDLKIHLRDNATRLAELDQQYKDGKISAEDYYYGVDQVTTDSKLSVEQYAEAIGNIPPEVITNIVTNMDPRAPDRIFNQLQTMMDNKTLFVTVEGVIADSALRNALEGRGPAGVVSGGGGGGSGHTPPSGGSSGGGNNGAPRLSSVGGPSRGDTGGISDIPIQITLELAGQGLATLTTVITAEQQRQARGTR